MCEKHMAVNNQQRFLCHTIKPNKKNKHIYSQINFD